ncbi:porin [Biformimicrobium ophioploci]|uniref:Porin n=1 Tax=Biformimicrobium ophioploci TaxID=3036711 RepID=A0ABQ6LUL3_9GAMM|nr:porin [Microbulbifer sp. NKW57]GMG85778.1 hypothetical protein MNKW57_00990 [Microbulbifer sp. NKW57]
MTHLPLPDHLRTRFPGSRPWHFGKISAAVLACLLAGAPALAEQSETVIPDTYWDIADMYENDKGDYLKLSGRLHADGAVFDANQGNYSDLLWRRFRFGVKGELSGMTYAIEADMNLNNTMTNWYNRLTDAYLQWKFDNGTKIRILKQSAGFTLDGGTSSKKLFTPQRNNLTNNLWFTAEYFTGVSVTNTFADEWEYYAGVFATDGDPEIGIDDAGYFTLFKLGREFGETRAWDKARFRFDYVYNDADPNANTRDYSDVYSVSSHIDRGDWEVRTDLAYGDGYDGQGDLWGFVVMPAYQQTDVVQWVVRFTHIESNRDGSVRLGRYESSVVSDRGDIYSEVFGGVNFYLNEHKFKIHLGAQVADAEGDDGRQYDGIGFTASLRIYW